MLYILLSCLSVTASAQSPQRQETASEADSTAMAVLDRYASSPQPAVEMWQPTVAAVKFKPIGERENVPMPSAAISVRVVLPKPVDMNKLVWKPSSSFSITISNGSAGNNMPWPNCPIGYLDARTLSFPLPR